MVIDFINNYHDTHLINTNAKIIIANIKLRLSYQLHQKIETPDKNQGAFSSDGTYFQTDAKLLSFQSAFVLMVLNNNSIIYTFFSRHFLSKFPLT